MNNNNISKIKIFFITIVVPIIKYKIINSYTYSNCKMVNFYLNCIPTKLTGPKNNHTTKNPNKFTLYLLHVVLNY